MGKSKLYYCDFCNRSFQDNVTARKKHLKSSIHSRNRNIWYQNFKDKASILKENQHKKPCHRFFSTGQCPYSDACRYRHLDDATLQNLAHEIEQESSSTQEVPIHQIVQDMISGRK